jgi:cytochrome c biogenesis protein CcmG, thiol:disulfide interchange protein DsbE
MLRIACVFLVLAAAAALSCGAAEKSADSGVSSGGPVGNPAPDFRIETVTGSKETLSLQQLRGQVVVVDFWGTFCEPCKKSFPKLQQLSKEYARSGVRFIGISEDEEEDKDKIPAFAATYGATFALGWDADRSIARRYDPETMPSSFLIDKNGIVRFVHVGFHDGEETVIDRELRVLVGR